MDKVRDSLPISGGLGKGAATLNLSESHLLDYTHLIARAFDVFLDTPDLFLDPKPFPKEWRDEAERGQVDRPYGLGS
jgi:hypothetical protein